MTAAEKAAVKMLHRRQLARGEVVPDFDKRGRKFVRGARMSWFMAVAGGMSWICGGGDGELMMDCGGEALSERGDGSD